MGANLRSTARMQYAVAMGWFLYLITVVVRLALLAGMVLALLARSSPGGWAGRVWFGIWNRIGGWLLGPRDPRDRALSHRRGLLEPLLSRRKQ